MIDPETASTRYRMPSSPKKIFGGLSGNRQKVTGQFADERGSVVAVTNASGAATAINSYDEYGIPGSGNAGTFQYTGQAWLPQLGLSYYKARMYSPTLGRFLQTDPIGYADGINWYNYVGGDPVNGSDPSGLRCKNITRNEVDENGDVTPTVVIGGGDCDGGGGGGGFLRLIGDVLNSVGNAFGSGGDSGGGGAVETAKKDEPQNPKPSVPCQRINDAVAKARKTLPSRVTSSTGGGAWNDIPTLRFYRSIYAGDASDAHWGGKALAIIGVPLSIVPLPQSKALALGIAGGSYSASELLSAEEGRKNDWVAGIDARIDQLQAQGEGSCQ